MLSMFSVQLYNWLTLHFLNRFFIFFVSHLYVNHTYMQIYSAIDVKMSSIFAFNARGTYPVVSCSRVDFSGT
jgi:hypothetical protein